MIERKVLKRFESKLFKNKALLIFGPRQVGKTTLMKNFYQSFDGEKQYLDCDILRDKNFLTDINPQAIKPLLGGCKLLCIDEAQRVSNIGLSLKILIDNFPEMQIIATGSSSFEIANQVNEPLTGRKYTFMLLPFSTSELWKHHGGVREHNELENRLIYGFYPEIVLHSEDAVGRLYELTGSYLYKDIFEHKAIRNPQLLNHILKALAYQVGSQVSYNEIAQLTKSSPKTVESYVYLLEQCFVIFRLHSFSRKLRNELSKSVKIYFYDNGVRNALISNLNPLSMRDDVGKLWENYLVSERKKHLLQVQSKAESYFWRTTQQQEIDYLEIIDNQINTFEFKFSANQKARLSKTFSNNYPNHTFQGIHNENYWEFVGVV